MKKSFKISTLAFFAFLIVHYTLTIDNCEAQWFQQYTTAGYELNSIAVTDANTVYITGTDITHTTAVNLKTTNGGTNWFQFASSNQGGVCVYFINSTTGFLTGLGFSILRTTNAGVNWYTVYTPSDTAVVTSMSFVNATTGFGAGFLFSYVNGPYAAMVVTTTNSGINWTRLPQPLPGVPYQVESCSFIDANTGFIGGIDNVLLNGLLSKTISGGQSWSVVWNPSANSIKDVMFINSTTGYAAYKGPTDPYGYADVIWKSTNTGMNWFGVFRTLGGIQVVDLHFVNLNIGYSAGQSPGSQGSPGSGLVYKTTNGGINWFTQTTSGDELNRVMFYDENTGWVVTRHGMIINTTNGGGPIGIEPISSEIPGNYSLSQNYPNPFNPKTKIRFSIPPYKGGQGDVSIKVYDALGREITTLVNEQLKPGTYEVEWDGTNYPSGVYYYKMQTGDYVDTKKMVLVK